MEGKLTKWALSLYSHHLANALLDGKIARSGGVSLDAVVHDVEMSEWKGEARTLDGVLTLSVLACTPMCDDRDDVLCVLDWYCG